MLEIIEKNPPPSHRGKHIKIKYIVQLPVAYPAFVFYANFPEQIKESYKNFLENQLRAIFPLSGVTISIYFEINSKTMGWRALNISGVYTYEPKIWGDDRGYFF